MTNPDFGCFASGVMCVSLFNIRLLICSHHLSQRKHRVHLERSLTKTEVSDGAYLIFAMGLFSQKSYLIHCT